MEEPLEIVILGGGTAGWMAAAGLGGACYPPSRCRVRLVESDEIGIVGVGEATLPHIKNFNDSLGIDEAEMMRATNATFKLGVQFVDWGFKGSSLCPPVRSSRIGRRRASASTSNGARSLDAGRDWDIQEFSFACMAAQANRFDFPATGKPTINSTYSYAYHFDASLYAKFLRQLAEPRGVVRTEGKVRDVEQDPDSGDIRALIMESGERIAGDFFIDCSGFRSLLLGGKLGAQWEDWSKWLPCDRALAGTDRTLRRTDALHARRRRWTRAGAGAFRCSTAPATAMSFPAASSTRTRRARSCSTRLDEPTLAEPRLLKFQAGRRVQSWQRNCVALGLSSGFLEPLESTSIYLIQIAIMHLLPLLPGKRHDQRLVDEFNRRMDVEYERIRDFLILHYHLNSRDDSELWRYCRTMEVPESLQRKIALFRHSGIVEQYKDGLFTPPSWLSVLPRPGPDAGAFQSACRSDAAQSPAQGTRRSARGHPRPDRRVAQAFVVHRALRQCAAARATRFCMKPKAGYERAGQIGRRRRPRRAVVARRGGGAASARPHRRARPRRRAAVAAHRSRCLCRSRRRLRAMHRLLGLDEQIVLKLCRAVPMVASALFQLGEERAALRPRL